MSLKDTSNNAVSLCFSKTLETSSQYHFTCPVKYMHSDKIICSLKILFNGVNSRRSIASFVKSLLSEFRRDDPASSADCNGRMILQDPPCFLSG